MVEGSRYQRRIHNDPIKQVCIAESRADKNFYVQVGINLETYEVFIVIKSLNLKITKTKTTEVYFGLFDKKDQVIVSVVLPAVVMDENRVIVPNFNVKNVSMFLESTNTKIVVKKDDDTAQMINLQSPTPKINDYFLECIEKGGK